MDELLKEVPKNLHELFAEIVHLTDAFCDAHLNGEYKALCRDMAASVCQKGSPVTGGKPVGWACGIIHTVGWVNFLSDPSQTPHMKNDAIARHMGVSVATMQAKSRVIRDGLDLMPMHPRWSLPSKLDDNPLVWMLKVDGVAMDIRMAPREVQAEAFRRGLIPYIPADRSAAKEA